MENVKSDESKVKVSRKFRDTLMAIYVVMICVGLPLIFHNQYFDILIIKYYYYCFCTITMLILLISSNVFYLKNSGQTFKNALKQILRGLTWADYSVICFYAVATLSTLTSDYIYESFWGNEGRLTGLFLITWYVLSYFCISRFWKFSIKYIDVLLIAGILVCLFGISDYFKLDILKFKINMVDNQRDIFTSTIGNINTYTAYVGIIVSISAVLFAMERKLLKSVFYFFTMVISYFAIIMGASDNAYLSIGALFALLPLYLFRNSDGIKKYFIILATFATVVQAIGVINHYLADQVIGIDSTFKLLIEIKAFVLIPIVLWLIVALWYLVDLYKKRANIKYNNKLCYLWFAILITMFFTIIFMLYDCNIAGHTMRYGILSNYLVFNDDWGTHRGYIWRNAIECYFDLSWWKKAVGYGPETFGILMLKKTAENPYNEIFDSAHNEYLHLLTTVGIFGLISYLSFILGIIINGVKKHINKPYIVAVLFSVVCYCVQAFVNLNIPIIAPIFWVLLSISSAKSLETE